MVTLPTTDGEKDVLALGEMYRDDLPNFTLLPTDLRKWKSKWENEDGDIPDTPACALVQCDSDVFPNISVLLKIACTIPVSSAQNERCNSALKRLKHYLRSTMGGDRLSALVLMQVHRSHGVDYGEIVSSFAHQHPCRMALIVPLADE